MNTGRFTGRLVARTQEGFEMSIWQEEDRPASTDGTLAAIIAFCWAKHPEWISDALDYAEERRTESGRAESGAESK